MAKVKLTKPIKVMGEEVMEFEIREDLTAGILMAGDRAKGEAGKTFEIMSAASSVPITSLKKMYPPDFMQAQTILDSILNGTYGAEEGGEGTHAVPQTGGTW